MRRKALSEVQSLPGKCLSFGAPLLPAIVSACPPPRSRCFRSFVDRFAPNIFSTAPEEAGGGTALVVLETHLVLLEQLLRFHDPALAAHMDKCFVSPAAYATPWWVLCQHFVAQGKQNNVVRNNLEIISYKNCVYFGMRGVLVSSGFFFFLCLQAELG